MRFALCLIASAVVITPVGLIGCGGDSGGDGDGDVDANAGSGDPTGVALEAESSFNRSSVDQLHGWVDNDSEAGFSGAGYAEALPNDGTTCADPFTGCGASLAFNVDIPETGTYFVYFHTYADELVDDSLAWSVNAGPSELVVHAEIGTWSWSASQNTFTAQPGPVVLTVHMTEDGIKLDQLVVSIDGDQL